MISAEQTVWDDRESKDTLRNMLMTSCDIASITKPWDIQRQVNYVIAAKENNIQRPPVQ